MGNSTHGLHQHSKFKMGGRLFSTFNDRGLYFDMSKGGRIAYFGGQTDFDCGVI